MKRIGVTILFAMFAVGAQAGAVGNLAEVAVIDRDSGVQLATYYHRGEYWVAGSPGARYAIEIRNRLGERLLAVASVDGVNVVSGQTAGWDQTGYVFGAGQSYRITGWRKNDSEVAAFSFTAAPNSYAERTGRPANVGVIGVAVFRERNEPQFAAPDIAADRLGETQADRDAGSDSRAAAAPGAPAAAARNESSQQSMSRVQPDRLFAAPKLGTAHGEREASPVLHTEFERLQPDPNEVIRIRYDSMANLLAMGVVPRRRVPLPVPNAFPVTPPFQYVPDPPG